jgi:radical SAM superfamily enzyme YgiQ (UPF0313 family)
MDEIFEDIEMARNYYPHVRKIFLCDGDALCLSTEKLLAILDKLAKTFPECERVGVYGSARDVERKTDEELRRLKDAGIDIVYLGAESGSEKVLKAINKGATREELISAVRRIEDSGMMASVTFISGLGGRALWEEHAVETGKMLSEMQPTYASLLTLMLEPGAPMREDVLSGRFELLTPEEVMGEALLLMENTNVEKKCIFRSNHASNYLALAGDLPRDKEAMMAQQWEAYSDVFFKIIRIIFDKGNIRTESFDLDNYEDPDQNGGLVPNFDSIRQSPAHLKTIKLHHKG